MPTNIFIYVPKRLRPVIENAAAKAGLSQSKWLLMLAEREIARLAKAAKS